MSLLNINSNKDVAKELLARWYNLDPVPVQLKLVADVRRYIVVPAGRRSGKTERAKRKIVKACMKHDNGLYFIAAPTYNQVKKIYWRDIKKLAKAAFLSRAPSESELIVYFPNGSELHLIGLDKPDRIEGIPWDGGIIDEAATVKEEAWESSIYPALQTVDPSRPGHKPWCWIIGRPKGLNWFYRLYKYARDMNDPDWGAYTWFSSEVLPAEEIAAAKRRMDPKLFRQEFEASFETTEGRIYDAYSSDNYTDAGIGSHELLHYFCDFNFTPMSHGIAVMRDHYCDVATREVVQAIYCLDEIILTSATGEQSALEFVEKYKHHKNKTLRLYGDRSGRNGEKHGHASEYIKMIAVFKSHGWRVEEYMLTKNPAIMDRQNSVRSLIRNAAGEIRLYINPTNAPWTHEGVATVCTKEGSTFLEDDKNKYQHITTALGYFTHCVAPVEGDGHTISIVPYGYESTNYYDNDDYDY